MRDEYLASIIFGFILGVFLRSFFVFSFPLLYFIVLVSGVCAACYFSFYKSEYLFCVALVLFSLAGGIFRFHISDRPIESSALFSSLNKHVQLHGIVVSNPDHKESSTDFVFKTQNEDILVKENLFSKVRYGDEVSVVGTLERPESFVSEIGKTFDYVSYLKKDGIDFMIKQGSVEVLSSGHGSFLKRILFKCTNAITLIIDRLFTPPESSLFSGILLGTKSSLGKELRDEFVNTGTIHIVALSGYNVTIVAEAVMSVFSRLLPFFISIGAGIFAIILFALMTGGGATVVRASIMAILVLVARATGRAADIGRALIATAFLMMLVNPWILVFDISFQLSFLATIGLVYLTPKIEPRLMRITDKWGLRTIIASTIATNIFVMPFIVYNMGILSLVALPANVLILPLMPLSMLLGTFVVALGAISSVVAFPFVFIMYSLLHYILAVIHFFSNLPFASVSFSHIPLSLVILSYILLLKWMFFPHTKIDKLV